MQSSDDYPTYIGKSNCGNFEVDQVSNFDKSLSYWIGMICVCFLFVENLDGVCFEFRRESFFFLFRCEDYIFVLMMVRLPINF